MFKFLPQFRLFLRPIEIEDDNGNWRPFRYGFYAYIPGVVNGFFVKSYS